MKKPRALVDTNIFISALLGSPSVIAIYNAFREQKFTLVISEEVLQELRDVSRRPELGINVNDSEELLSMIKLGAVIFNVSLKVNDCRDPKDNFLLACCLEAKPDFLITGDKDLLSLDPYHSISIITLKEFLTRLKK